MPDTFFHLREKEFIHAAKALGGSPARVLVFHIIPNLLSPLLIQATFGMAAAILAEGSLSFLGLGVQPPTPSWGSMINEGRQFLLVAPHPDYLPGFSDYDDCPGPESRRRWAERPAGEKGEIILAFC